MLSVLSTSTAGRLPAEPIPCCSLRNTPGAMYLPTDSEAPPPPSPPVSTSRLSTPRVSRTRTVGPPPEPHRPKDTAPEGRKSDAQGNRGTEQVDGVAARRS